MTAQHPAAPEAEVSALTEAERDALRGLALTVPDRVRLEAAVERIVAERLRVVEDERDNARRVATMYQRQIKALRAGIEALADEWQANAAANERAGQFPWAMWQNRANDLRALLPGDGR